ncbi:MAG: c-type cytochrome, partial [Gemmatimonadota bacterium]
AAQVAVNLGGPENLAFYRMKGKAHRPDRFSEVKATYASRAPVDAVLFPARLTGRPTVVASTEGVPAASYPAAAEERPRPAMERFNGTLIPMPPSEPISRGSDLSGKEIFRLNCAVCHGARGEGITGKPLAQIAGKDREAIFEVPKKGRFTQGMPPWGEGLDELAGVLTDEEIWRVVEYVKRLFEKPTTDTN